MNPPPRWLRGTFLPALLLFAGGLLFLSAMDRDLNHDEHQFIAPGVLISREGLLPYRDFPMFHLPNLAFIYAGLDRLTHQPVFAAKLLNTLASTAVIGFILMVGTASRDVVPLASRHFWCALAAVALLLSDQLFTYAAGKIWNHELPAFLLIAAILSHVRCVETGQWGWAALSGFCISAAIGTRLTYAPIALAFPCLLAVAPLTRRARLLAVAAWLMAGLIASLPSLYFFCADRERFLYNNLDFPRLRLLDPTDKAHKTMTLWRKMRYFFKEIIQHSLPLTMTFIVASVEPVRRRIRFLEPLRYGYIVCLVVLPLALAGCFLPSRYQYQHYFAFAPLTALAIAYSLRGWKAQTLWYGPAAIVVAVVVGLSPLNTHSAKVSGGIRQYRAVPAMLDTREWFTTKLRSEYAFIRAAKGRVLTLAPIGVLEAGGRIYPEFATGPFAWRTAHLLENERRKHLDLIAPDDLGELLRAIPPGGILTGVEDAELEKDFISYAESHGFHATPGGRRRVLWLPD